ncbi:hypothetical protein Tco_1421286, partial [Tanacetum coccineum]
MVEKDLPSNNAKVIAPRMFKLDLEPLSPKVLKNRDAHIDYIKHSREHDETLQEIVKHAKALRPLNSDLDSTYKISNNSESNQSWGSNASNVPSSSLINFMLFKLFSGTVRFGNDQIAKIMGY